MRIVLLFWIIKTVAAQSCRCFPNDPCWPSPSTWTAFNNSINGHLIATRPLATPCHDPSYNETTCTILRHKWTSPEPHYESSSSIMAPFFANDTCDPFHPREKECILGNYISYAVNVSSPKDVSTSLLFAKKHNIRLVIRNTGHDYLGRSTGAGGLGLWMHNLKDVKIHDFKDQSYNGPAMTIGAGIQGFEALAAADKSGYQMLSGACPSVGIAGGYTQGGGHSPLSSMYGLAADQALAWEVIDGRGQHITATRENEHSDLYWALSGGGGGTYAVVLSLTVKVHAGTPVSGLNLTFSREGISTERYYQAINLFQTIQPALTDAGAMGISIFTNESFILSPLHGPDIPVETLLNLIEPFTSALEDLGINYTLYSAQFDSYLAEFKGMQEIRPIDVGVAQYGSWLIPRSVVEDNNEGLTDAFRYIVETGGTVINTSLNVSRAVAGDVYNSVLPAWRDAVIHSTITTTWEWNHPGKMREMQERMTEEYIPRLMELAPRSGAYGNEGDFQQPDFPRAFYGESYDRLREIKKKYDPHDIFYALTGVGSGYWTQHDDGRLCRVESEEQMPYVRLLSQ